MSRWRAAVSLERRALVPLTIATAVVCVVAAAGVSEAPGDATPTSAALIREPRIGLASWYGEFHHGKLTASGEPFDMHSLTAAHRSLPLGSVLLVENVRTGRGVWVRVNDRGPYHQARELDLSYAAARALGGVRDGVILVRYRVVEVG
jgi:rare lipoprotein A